MDLGNSSAASRARSLKFAAQIVNTFRPANGQLSSERTVMDACSR
jgi:hypothetical protein